MEGTYDRSKRILHLKRIIVTAIITVIIVLTAVCIVLGVRVGQLKEKVKDNFGLPAFFSSVFRRAAGFSLYSPAPSTPYTACSCVKPSYSS